VIVSIRDIHRGEIFALLDPNGFCIAPIRASFFLHEKENWVRSKASFDA
jgi:hypothetical protein